jgi:hypothetical protein
LAQASGVGRRTIADFELKSRTPLVTTLTDIIKALEDAGVEFTTGDDDSMASGGVAWRAGGRSRPRSKFLHSLRRVGPISYREAGLARLGRAFDRINADMKDIKGAAIHGDGDTAGMLDILRIQLDAILDDREVERMLQNIAYAIETAFDLGRVTGADQAMKDPNGR